MAKSLLKLYFDDIAATTLLTPEEEMEYARRVQEGDMEARNKMIESNLRLVVTLAKKYAGGLIPFVDLIQAGNEGLIRAVERYDYTRGFKFASYAMWGIRAYIIRTLENHGRTIRFPVNVAARYFKIRKFIAIYEG